jgi:hypothetical protein
MAKSVPKNDIKQDMTMVKRGVGQHETAMHKGKKKTKLKLGKTK